MSLSAEDSVLGIFLAEHRRIEHLHCGIPWRSMGDELISVKSSQLPAVEHIALRIHTDQPNLSFLQNIPSLIRLDIVDHHYPQSSQLVRVSCAGWELITHTIINQHYSSIYSKIRLKSDIWFLG